MKRTLLLMSAIIMAFSSFAQTWQSVSNTPSVNDAGQSLRASITPADGQMWWGYFNESDFDEGDRQIGVGSAIPFLAGIYVPANNEQIGQSTIKAVRIYIGEGVPNTISSLKIWISQNRPATLNAADYVQDVTGSYSLGANDFELTTPFEVNNQAFYIGYYINSSYTHPLRSGGADAPNAFWVCSPENMDWQDLNGNGLGKLAFQVLVEGATINNDCATIADFGPAIASPGQSLELPIKITNSGMNDITSISYTVTVNGTTSDEKTITTPAIPFNGTRQVLATIETAPEEGTFTYTITITKVNGNANTASQPTATGSITTISNLKTYPRNVLIEEFTTEYCGYCPQAASGLANFMNTYPDLAARTAVVCHHSGYYTDWLTISASTDYLWFYNSGSTYAPAFMYDRYTWSGNTPVVNRESGAAGYKNKVESRIAETSYAGIDLVATFNEAKSQIQVTANCERGWEFCSNPRITLFLTEDNIKAKSQSGGGSNFVHQHVLRAVNTSWGSPLEWTDDKAVYSYTFNVNSAWKTENLKVVAIIANYDFTNPTNCVVENTAVVVPSTEATGISTVNSNNATETVRYTLDGRQISAPQHGLNIIKMSDGTVRKVVVK